MKKMGHHHEEVLATEPGDWENLANRNGDYRFLDGKMTGHAESSLLL